MGVSIPPEEAVPLGMEKLNVHWIREGAYKQKHEELCSLHVWAHACETLVLFPCSNQCSHIWYQVVMAAGSGIQVLPFLPVGEYPTCLACHAYPLSFILLQWIYNYLMKTGTCCKTYYNLMFKAFIQRCRFKSRLAEKEIEQWSPTSKVGALSTIGEKEVGSEGRIFLWHGLYAKEMV